ncbi:unnamed protein product [Cuscuta campestris]|uniref:Uncharacterized protein n=1 Tax=Cuscuta campestris TaxID=132261 RepID=A0A484MTC6_9ASTE|nr:unnamed protein product [Cuscuta campestris]
MNHWAHRLPDSVSRLELGNEIIFTTLKQSLDIPDSHKDDSVPICAMEGRDASSTTEQPNLGARAPTLDPQADAAIRYLTQILMEDSLDENDQSLSYDPIALRAAENSFYEALRQNPSPPHQEPLFINNNSERPHCATDSSFEPDRWIVDHEEPKSFLAGDPPESSFRSSSQPNTGSTRSKKHNHPDDTGLEEERRSKYSAACKEEEEVELWEMIDKLLISTDNIIVYGVPSVVGGKGTQQNGRSGMKSHSNRKRDNTEVVDLETLLMSCARSIAAFDHESAQEELKMIKKHSSPTGDANQRMAHAFANALEARLNGTGPELYAALAPNNMIPSEMLKSHLTSWPIARISYFLSNKTIHEVVSKGTSVHVIDFGVFFGIQWPTLIRDLSQRPGGPPNLRITGIEYPQPGFRPEQMVEETGRRLAKYCEQFGVPFEYNAITTKSWEKIKIDDLKLAKGELVAVNCLFRLKTLMDETVGEDDNPRDAVLNLIREINPRVFVPTVLSGSHSCPIFLSRFREAFLFYSTAFDMLDATVPDDGSRLSFEREFIRREIMNVIACEDTERVERPETHKQWQSRFVRAGFRAMPVNQKLVKKVKDKVEVGYHKDFVFDEDGHWVLQGWKGRTICGTSCWVPTSHYG